MKMEQRIARSWGHALKPIDENHQSKCKSPLSQMTMWSGLSNFVKSEAKPIMMMPLIRSIELNFDGGMGIERGDPLFEEAKALVIETPKSASMIQRRLSVWF